MPDNLDDVEFLKQHLSGDPSEELLEQIASTVVDRMADSFPELSLKSRPMEVILDEFREKKLEEVESTGQYRRKLDYLQTYLEDEARIESTEDLTSEDVERYNKWRFLLSAKFPEVGSCGHSNVDSSDVLLGPKGSSASHSVGIAVNENETDAVNDIILTEPLNSVPQIPIKMSICMTSRSWLSGPHVHQIYDFSNRWIC